MVRGTSKTPYSSLGPFRTHSMGNQGILPGVGASRWNPTSRRASKNWPSCGGASDTGSSTRPSPPNREAGTVLEAPKFLARRKGASNCVDLVPKYFFTELKIDRNGLSCVSCIKIDSVESKKLGGCGVCPENILHPAVGVYKGAQPCRDRPAPGGLEISFSF
ncbi:hypothetical protein ZWY2020_023447 [Hordeum vulgare]|nr:hypothetical protein ZWY2020_023447 [Hordeum vulgare]